MDVRAVLARAVAELSGAEAELRSAQERVNQLRMIRDGLELAVERYVSDQDGGTGRETERAAAVRPSGTGTAAGVPERRDASQAAAQPESHTEISYDALKGIGRPASTDEVHERAVENGHPLNREQVRNGLTYLRRTERIVRVAPGTWAIPPDADTQKDFTPATEVARVSQAGENGHSTQVGPFSPEREYSPHSQ